MLQLYKSLVRPRLEFYNQAWRPYLNKNSSGDEIVNVNFFTTSVASRIDYCNSVLYRVTAVHLRPLQSVLNAAARLVLKLCKFDRVSISATIRNELHWLPVHKRIVYKPCLLVFKCQHEQAPIYLSSLCSPFSAVNPSSAAGGNPRRP